MNTQHMPLRQKAEETERGKRRKWCGTVPDLKSDVFFLPIFSPRQIFFLFLGFKMAEKAECANDEIRSMKEELAQEKARNAALLQELERARHGKSLQHSFKCRVFCWNVQICMREHTLISISLGLLFTRRWAAYGAGKGSSHK
jgi:hypothetical protein